MKVPFAVQKCMQHIVGTTPSIALVALLAASAPMSMAATFAISAPEEPTVYEHLIEPDCLPLLSQGDALRAFQLARVQLLAHGIKLIPQGCPYVRVAPGQMQQVLDVRLVVANSDVAAQFVRGPLADGAEVDMGGVHFTLPALAQDVAYAKEENVSPDVVFNRQWLVDVMQSNGWQGIPGHWWAFVPEPVHY